MDERIPRRKREDSEREAPVCHLQQRCLGEAGESARTHENVSLPQGWQRVAVVISDNGEDVHGKLPSRTWSHW